jgi:hypothetical protein
VKAKLVMRLVEHERVRGGCLPSAFADTTLSVQRRATPKLELVMAWIKAERGQVA